MSARHFSRAKLLGSLLLAAAIFAFLFRRVDVAGVRAEIQEMTWFELLTITVVAVWNLVTYWALWMAVTPGLSWVQAMTVAQSGTAVTNTVPGGSGIGVGLAYAMLDSWGFSRARSTLADPVTGVRPGRLRGRPGPGDRLGAGLPGPHLAAAGPPGAATYLGWRWREHRRAAACTAAAPAVPVDQHSPSV